MLSVLSNTKPVLVRPQDAAALVIDTEGLGGGAWGQMYISPITLALASAPDQLHFCDA
jgi:hypothetical protein